MAVNFNKDSVFNLKPIDAGDVRRELHGFLIPGEGVIAAFKTVRDQLVFTNKRIISIDVQGLTGTRKSYTSMPYSKISFFSVQTPGFGELLPDSELSITFSNNFVATFEFKGRVNIAELCQAISQYVLEG